MGTKNRPGRHVRQKSSLNRVILDQGWGTFKRLIEYKQLWKGRLTVLVDPAYTSQECSVCGHVSPENRLARELFYCKKCGHTSNADENAARVVLSRVSTPRTPVDLTVRQCRQNQEPTGTRHTTVLLESPAFRRGGWQVFFLFWFAL